MPSRDEVEQELDIVSAERDAAEGRARDLQKEVEKLNGQIALMQQRAADADPELALALQVTPEEVDKHRELEILRAGVDADLEALEEMRNPTGGLLKQDKPESAIDIVRANQRERAELQERGAKANNLLSRIAAAVNLDRWDTEDGEVLLDRVRSYHHNRIKVAAKVKELKKIDAKDKEPDEATSGEWAKTNAYRKGQIAALEWATAQGLQKAPVDLNNLRRIVFLVSGHEVAYHCPPEMTVKDARDTVLGIFYPLGSRERTAIPFDTYLVYDEGGKNLDLAKAMRETPLPTERIVVTLPSGHGG